MAKLFCPQCLKKRKLAVLTFSLRYMKNTKWHKPEKPQYCENCKNYFQPSDCETGHYYNKLEGGD